MSSHEAQGTRQVVTELVVTVAIPSVLLMFASGDDRLGPLWGLVVALLFPLGWGVYGMLRAGRVSALAVIAFVSIGLTGGVGLFQLEARWIALKEAAVPLLLGLAAIGTAHTRWALVPTLLDRLLDPERVDAALHEQGTADRWQRLTVSSTRRIGAVFVVSAAVTWVLARVMVTSQAGTTAFNEELGRFTAVSFPAIALPMMVGMAWVLKGVLDGLEACTGAEVDDLLRTTPEGDSG
jgi:hypothetical protein